MRYTAWEEFWWNSITGARTVVDRVAMALLENKKMCIRDSFYASAGVPRPQVAQEVRRGIGGLLRVGRQETQPRDCLLYTSRCV